jgi:hypothetical protein
MYEIIVAVVSLCLMALCFIAGTKLQRLLTDSHRTQHSIESIRVILTLLATFAAVVLGLVTSAAQDRFSKLEEGLRALSINITELDNRLRDYGGNTAKIRDDLRTYTKAAIASTWPDEPLPSGDYPKNLETTAGGVESLELGRIVNRIDLAIRHLVPPDDFHRSVANSLQTRVTLLIDDRWRIIARSQPSLKWPFLVVLLFWLSVIFVVAGLNSPRNMLIFSVALLAAISVASSIFLALELDSPLTGSIALSSDSMRDALSHIEMSAAAD